MDYDMEDVSFSPIEQEKIPDRPNWVEPPGPLDSLYQDEGSMLLVTCWDDQTTTPERLNEFLTRWPPSRTPIDYCAWIAVDRGGHQRHIPNIKGLNSSFESLIASENVTVPEIDRIALENGVLSGKWMIYSDTRRIDELWGKVVRLLCLELKKGSIKVSPNQEEDSHVICVYVDDYSNASELDATRKALRAAGIFWRIGFKPDAYTHLGIYASNEWNIRPSRYFS
jgi:hypothetical protein